MTTETNKAVQPKPASKNAGMLQMKLMLGFTALFIGGILIYTLAPEGSIRGIGMSLYTGATLFFLFKYCI